MRKDGLESSIRDDTRNDWLAKELREENYHGCMDHGGAHVAGRANNRGWAAKSAMREGYRECSPHEKRHFSTETGENNASPLRILGIVISTIVILNVLLNLVFGFALL